MSSILAFSGSLRCLSSNTALIRYAAHQSSSIIIAPRLDRLPFYDQDIEDEGLPPAVAAIRKQAFEAKAFLFSTPEYNGFTSAVLKNAIDWLSRAGKEKQSPLKGKPYAIMSTGGGGGLRGQRNIISIASDCKMIHIGAEFPPIAVKLFDGAQHFEAKNGDLTDAAVQAQIALLVKQLETAAAATAKKM
jgi:NAD(P)H-dependent FMN reductase